MASEIVDSEQERIKRDIRLRIGRLRRRMGGHVRQCERRARELLSWQTYVKGLPGCAVAGAMGVGLAISADATRRRLARWLGLRLLRHAAKAFSGLFWNELRQIWAESREQSAPSQAKEDDRA